MDDTLQKNLNKQPNTDIKLKSDTPMYLNEESMYSKSSSMYVTPVKRSMQMTLFYDHFTN